LNRILTRSFRADRQAPGKARSALRVLNGNIDREIAEDVRLLVSELVTNSLRHAGLPNAATVRVSAQLADGVLRLEVEDGGTGGAVSRRKPNRDRGGGFGLNIVDALAARWGVERDGSTLVWVELAAVRTTG